MSHATPEERQRALIERYSIIPDPQERLAALISKRPALPTVPENERTPEHLVEGCQSRVWITSHVEAGRCHFQMEAESAMVRGLVALLCELYSDATPADILATEPTLFEALGIARNLTPTRLNGIAAVTQHLKALASRQL